LVSLCGRIYLYSQKQIAKKKNRRKMSSQSLTPNSSSGAVQKRVNFNSNCNESCAPQTQEFDSFFVYYNKAEYECIKDDCHAVLLMIKTSVPGAEDFFRGLEGRTLTGMRRAQNNRRRARWAVMDEVCRQEDEGEHDPEMLAVLYKGYSTHSLIQAQRMGKRDAAVAKNIALERFDTFKKKDEACDDFTAYTVDTTDTASMASDLLDEESSLKSDKKKMSCKRMIGQLFRPKRSLSKTAFVL
jgi:hypothetical protein